MNSQNIQKSENQKVISGVSTNGPSSTSQVALNQTEPIGEPINADRGFRESNDIVVAGTTTVHSDYATKRVTLSNFSRDISVEDSLEEQNKHSIETFLARPYVIYAGNLSTSDGQGNSLVPGVYRIPSQTLPPIYLNKLSGFYGFKADFVMRLQVNANRFQQGRLILSYVPWPSSDDGIYHQIVGNTNLVTLTQLPRVELDLATETEVTLRIPYYSPFPYYPLIDSAPANYDWAAFSLNVYSALEDPSGSGGVDFTLWGHYENVDVVLPTQALDPSKYGPTTGLEAQAGGSISSSLGAVSKAANALSLVPVLKPYLSPIAWATNILAGTAAAFGFCKPPNEIPPSGALLHSMHNYANVNGEDGSKKLGLLADGEVACLPKFGGFDVDEMSFEHILSVPAYIRTFTWTTAQAEDSVIWSPQVSPLNFSTTVGYGSSEASVITGPAVSMLPRWFQYWRGGFRFKLKFVKTEFHSGRLVIAFAPTTESSALTAITAENSNYLHRDIVDIRTLTEYEFSVPYVSVRPYSTSVSDIGTLSIVVLNPLRAPSSVAQSIQILVEVSALPDFEVAGPSQYWPFLNNAGGISLANHVGVQSSYFTAFTPKTPTSSEVPHTIEAGPSGLEAQGGEPNDEEQINLDRDIPMDNAKTLGALSSPSDLRIVPAQVCIGERITSFRQMIRRFEPTSAPMITGPDTAHPESGPNNFTYDVRPWMQQFYTFTDGTSDVWAVAQGGGVQNFFSVVCGMYRFMRGSMRLKFSPVIDRPELLVSTKIYTWDQNNVDAAMVSTFNSSGPDADPAAFQLYGQTNQQWNKTNINGALEVEVPFYSYTPYVPTHFTGNFYLPKLLYTSYDPELTTDTGGWFLHRAAGDDFECGFYTGFPPIRATLTTNDFSESSTANNQLDRDGTLTNNGWALGSTTNFPAPNVATQTGY